MRPCKHEWVQTVSHMWRRVRFPDCRRHWHGVHMDKTGAWQAFEWRVWVCRRCRRAGYGVPA